MPPKGSGRARGGARGGRGGGRAGASSTAHAKTAPQDTSTGAGAAQPEPEVVPKQEDGAIAPDANISATVEATSATAIATTAESSTRPPRQRLDSLKSAQQSSRSASPSLRRGSSARGKKPLALPTFSGRRSKEERDARTAADAARERERHEHREKEANYQQKRKEALEKRAADRKDRGRGGYSGAVSGPFSMAAAKDRRATRNFTGYGGGSGSRATRVKDENDSYAGPSRSGGSSIKKEYGGGEDGGYVSSDDEQDASFPRKDIDLIEISSDEDEATSLVRLRTQLPVRICRKEHKERAVGINTDASTETSAKLLQEAEASGNSPSAGASNKGKGKAKDVEFIGERRPFKGVWQDPEDIETTVKSEPVSDEEAMMVDAEEVGIGAGASVAVTLQTPSHGTERKPKLREIKEPNLQTDEERAEWARFQANLRHVREELGPEDDLPPDPSGDVAMVDTGASKPNRRDNHVYLFQLPPIIPELLESMVKKALSDPQSKAHEPAQPPKGEGAVQVKQEEGEFSSTIPKAPEGPRIGSGRVGKLRVHQSGRTTLDWGGVDYELTPGKPASFLQDVVSMRILPKQERVAEEMGGDAISFGRVKGKFVVTPDTSTMFG
ncbi:hypothetical protein CC80DRAFT_534425 [Byssothecium circinans]|uniref:RNA polymerase III RPC4-domain-containing protein n=1 Tax=Byssothecium circinans TaxID=147558 RepID=A0A6A5TYH6_9PLEO|nr:hypothetical protein CC80DRAFT_534425 [Byssothecium circinans]